MNSTVKKNTIANYVGQIYMVCIGILVMPIYLDYLGAESFGLVGLLTLVQVWFSLLDMGMSPTINRQASVAKATTKGYVHFFRLLHSLEFIFFSVATILIVTVYFSSPWISENWLVLNTLEVELVSKCVIIIALIASLRWSTTLYRSAVSGLEDQVWLNITSICLITAKCLGSIIYLHWLSTDIFKFLIFQSIFPLVELFLIRHRLYRQAPTRQSPKKRFSWTILKPIMPFTLGIAYTSAIAILITQLDKILLSRILSLDNFGYLALVLLMTTGVSELAQPIGKAVLPRITYLVEKSQILESQRLYFTATQLTAVLVFPAVGFLVVYSHEVLHLWSGNPRFANWGANVLIWYGLGAGVAAINTFQYYLQCAFGSIRLHVIGTTTTAIIQIPFIYYSATEYGAVGAGIVWFTFRVLYFFVWTPVVHARFLNGLHVRWLLETILPIVSIVVFMSYIAEHFIPISFDKGPLLAAMQLLFVAIIFISTAALTSPVIRAHIGTTLSFYRTR